MSQKQVVLVYLIMSVAAAGVLIIIAIYGPSDGRTLSSFDRLVVGSAFIASCLYGILSSMNLFHLGRRSKKGRRSEMGSDAPLRRSRIGHHPDCERFQDHVVAIGGRAYCGGCLGLALGSVIALVLMVAYLPGSSISPDAGLFIVLSGLILVAIALFETAIHSRIGSLHVLANIVLVVGFLLITVGVSGAAGMGAMGLIAVLISYLFLDTRIRISEWKHGEICGKCGQDCKSY